MKILGRVDIQVLVEETVKIELDCYILEGMSQHMIIGRDVLGNSITGIDMTRAKLCIKREKRSENVSSVVANDYVLPLHSMVCMEVVTVKKNKPRRGIMKEEPKTDDVIKGMDDENETFEPNHEEKEGVGDECINVFSTEEIQRRNLLYNGVLGKTLERKHVSNASMISQEIRRENDKDRILKNVLKRNCQANLIVFLILNLMNGCLAKQNNKVDNTNNDSLVSKLGVLTEQSGENCHTNRVSYNLERQIGTETLCTHYRKIKLKSDECGTNDVEIFGCDSGAVNDYFVRQENR